MRLLLTGISLGISNLNMSVKPVSPQFHCSVNRLASVCIISATLATAGCQLQPHASVVTLAGSAELARVSTELERAHENIRTSCSEGFLSEEEVPGATCAASRWNGASILSEAAITVYVSRDSHSLSQAEARVSRAAVDLAELLSGAKDHDDLMLRGGIASSIAMMSKASPPSLRSKFNGALTRYDQADAAYGYISNAYSTVDERGGCLGATVSVAADDDGAGDVLFWLSSAFAARAYFEITNDSRFHDLELRYRSKLLQLNVSACSSRVKALSAVLSE